MVLKSVWEAIGGVAKKLGFMSEGGTRGTAKMITKFVALAAVFAPVALAVGGVTKLFGGLAKVALGAAKVVGNTLALGAKAAGGLLGAVGKRFPKVGGLLGKFGGLLGKAGRLAEQATAQPVRVVNFHEAGMMGGLGGAAGQMQLPFGQGAGAGGPGGLAGLRAKLAGFVGRFGVVGRLLNTNLLAAARGSGSLATKLLGAGGTVAAVGAAGFAGWKFGKWLDKKFGISSKIADGLWKLLHASEEVERKSRLRAHTHNVAVANATRMANQLAQLSQRGIKTIQIEGGKRVALTRELAKERISKFLKQQNWSQQQIEHALKGLQSTLRGIKVPSKTAGTAPAKPVKPAKDAIVTGGGFMPVSAGDVVLDRASLAQAVVSSMRGGLAGRAGAGALGGGDPGRASPPAAGGGAPLRIEIPVQIDGRQVALAVAEIQLDELERSGATVKPGDRTLLLERGFAGAT